MKPCAWLLLIVLASACDSVRCRAAEIRFVVQADSLEIRDGEAEAATYVFRDEEIPRPYFCKVISPDGSQVTRHHPPHDDDLQDHATFHPGIWLAFGDISGNDFWRLKARVEHVEFVERPRSNNNIGSFTVLNRYLTESGDEVVCREICRHEWRVIENAYVLTFDSTFHSDREFAFGDQEEMGLGVRLATPIAENQEQSGLLTDSAGRTTAGDIWGRQADWCDYSGVVNGRAVGITILAHPENFRDAWWHARDYGFVAANPFGRRAFTGGEPSRVVIVPGQDLRLRFAVVIHDGRPGEGFEPGPVYGNYASSQW